MDPTALPSRRAVGLVATLVVAAAGERPPVRAGALGAVRARPCGSARWMDVAVVTAADDSP